jgi:hypothetical protein
MSLILTGAAIIKKAKLQQWTLGLWVFGMPDDGV